MPGNINNIDGLSRRQLLTGAGEILAASMLPFKVSAQASARIVVIGGGWGGISAARSLKAVLPDSDVTMVEPKDMFMSCPLSIHYIVGQRSADSLTFDFSNLRADGVKHVQEIAETIDRAAQEVITPTQRLPTTFSSWHRASTIWKTPFRALQYTATKSPSVSALLKSRR